MVFKKKGVKIEEACTTKRHVKGATILKKNHVIHVPSWAKAPDPMRSVDGDR
jgi:hypothetical protein